MAKERGTRSPSWKLDDAVELVRRVKNAIGVGSASGDVVAKGLGHPSIRNGAATTKIGTLTHFGLLDREGGGKYRLSELARQICTPRSDEERRHALAEAAKTPNLYRDLVTKYEGQALPTLLPNILNREFGVLEKNADEVSETFKASMEYAGLLRNGVLYSAVDHRTENKSAEDEPDAAIREATTPDRPGSFRGQLSDIGPSDQGGSERATRFQILLSGRRAAYLTLPTSIDKSDLDRISRWIEFNEELLTNEEAVGDDADG